MPPDASERRPGRAGRPAAATQQRAARRTARQAERDGSAPAANRAYTRIVDLIFDRQLRPGERTSVNLLAERLGLGRTPVKEAITRLQAEGVLSVVGRSGTTVRSLGAEEARQLFALRRLLEAAAVPDAVRRVTPRQLKALRGLLEEMRAASFRPGSADAVARFIHANAALHAGIVAAAGNPFLDRLYAQIQVQAQIVAYLAHRGYDPEAAERRHSEHEAIVAALAAGDAAALERLLAEHAAHTEAFILQAASAAAPPGGMA